VATSAQATPHLSGLTPAEAHLTGPQTAKHSPRTAAGIMKLTEGAAPSYVYVEGALFTTGAHPQSDLVR